jgi:nucleotide-binding universal stress UspA family protein
MFKKILVPLDGSKRAEAILTHVEDLARRYEKSQVVLLQVVEPVPETLYMSYPIPPLNPEAMDRVYKDARRYLEKIQARLKKKNIVAHVHVLFGPVVSTIVDLAGRQKVDLIALASHGRSGLPSIFYGNVAAGVLHRADRPLLVIRSLRDGVGSAALRKPDGVKKT